jgi:hypothetical protein
MIRTALTLIRFALALAVTLTIPALPVHADSQDIAAVSRSVVRVAIVAMKDGNAYFVGHGSGVMVAPDKVLTNAHVVELVRSEPALVIGVIPAEGSDSYGARIVAFSPGNDLALLQIANGRLQPATFFAGAAQDGQEVVAIGYPGSVDRAQGMTLSDIIQPMSPIKVTGNLSGGRSSKNYDTLLHTAPVAAGNSGGPLVDTCGRVLGINSHGTVSDGNDATFAFAVSNREIASFLRQAGVQPQRTVIPCRSLADLEAADRAAAEQQRIEAERKAELEADADKDRELKAIQQAQQSVISSRENALAIAAVLLALSVLSAGAVGVTLTQGRKSHARWFGVAAGLLFIAAAAVFALRPGFGEVEDRAAEFRRQMPDPAAPDDGTAAQVASYDPVGDNLCRVDIERSRITVSDTSDVPFNWSAGGCINGRTQLASNGKLWSRAFVSMEDESVSIRSFDPATGAYRADRYMIDAATAEEARKTRKLLTFSGCTADPQQLDAIATMEGQVRALLPPQPTERIVYKCSRSASAAPAPSGETRP